MFRGLVNIKRPKKFIWPLAYLFILTPLLAIACHCHVQCRGMPHPRITGRAQSSDTAMQPLITCQVLKDKYPNFEVGLKCILTVNPYLLVCSCIKRKSDVNK